MKITVDLQKNELKNSLKCFVKSMQEKILVCSNHGHPVGWANWQSAIRLKCNGSVSYELGEHQFVFYGGISKLTGKRSQISLSSILFVDSSIKRNFKTPILTASNVFSRDFYICAYCGKHCKSDATIDHVVPTSRGGLHSWTNVVCSCLKCNLEKGNHLLEKLGWELLYVPYTPSFEEALILKNRKILADQMEFLKQFLPKHSRVLKGICNG